MKHAPVKSSQIESVAHDPDAKVLEIKFKSGAHYEYQGVSSADHQALMDAESVGKHFGAHIRGKFPHKHLNPKVKAT